MLATLITVTALSAPVPPVRVKPAVQVAAGDYELKWASGRYAMRLYDGGDYVCDRWRGSWHWDAKTRTLHVSETSDGGWTYFHWFTQLDGELTGKGGYDNSERVIAIGLRKVKPRVEEYDR